MKALMLKDLKLLKQQKIFIALILLVGIFLSVSQIMDSSFTICYMTFVSSIFVVSSMSYDEDKDGYFFLFTLPITRKDYVKEKYCFGFLISFCFWVFSVLLILGIQLSQGASFIYINYFALCFIILCASLILTYLIIPIQMRFGKSNGEIAMVVIAGLAFVIAIACVKFPMYLPIPLTAFSELFHRIGFLGVGACLFIMMLLVLQISYHRSLKMMRRKEL